VHVWYGVELQLRGVGEIVSEDVGEGVDYEVVRSRGVVEDEV
jgi:hypothetical protein